MPNMRVNRNDIYFEDTGAGVPLLFVHGTTGDTSLWQEQVERLSPHFRCITYDRRGYKRSPFGDPPTQSIQDEADDAAGLIQALRIAPCIVVGISHGALVAADLVRRHADLLLGAVLCEPPIFAMDPEAASAFFSEVQLKMEHAVATGGPPAAVDVFLAAACPTMWAGFDEARRERHRANHAGMFADFPKNISYQISDDDFRAFRMPCVMLAGELSAPFLHDVAHRIAGDIPGAKFTEIAGSGHVPFVEKPDEAAAVIMSFARTVGGGGGRS